MVVFANFILVEEEVAVVVGGLELKKKAALVNHRIQKFPQHIARSQFQSSWV